MTKHISKQGIKVPFNKRNVYGDEPCCCQKGYYTKFLISTIFCVVCNLLCLRKRKKTGSFCKKYGWAEECETCNQKENYTLR